jgi:hypothetical protein
VVIAERPDYEVGDILRANCTIDPSRPVANLSFYINDVLVSTAVHALKAEDEDNIFSHTMEAIIACL